jgi:hypothetical protein
MKNDGRMVSKHLVSKATITGAGHGIDDLSDAKHMGHDGSGRQRLGDDDFTQRSTILKTTGLGGDIGNHMQAALAG